MPWCSAMVRDRGLRSPTLCRRLLVVLAGGHGVERGAGHAQAAQIRRGRNITRAGLAALHRHDLRRPKGLKVPVASRTCMALSDPLHGAIQRCTGSPLRCLSEASIPPIAFHANAYGRSLRPTGATEVAPARHAKAAERPHACAPPSIAGQVPAGLPAKPGLENVDEPSSPALRTGPSTQLGSENDGHVPVLLGHGIKPILCKEIGSESK